MSQKPRFDSDLWLLGGQNENVLFNSPKPHRSDPNVLGGQEIRQGVKSLPRVGDWPGCRPTRWVEGQRRRQKSTNLPVRGGRVA